MIKCEFAFWCMSIVTNAVLLVSIIYTFRQLKSIFSGESFSDYHLMIKRIAVLFFISIMVKSIYAWTLYYEVINFHSETALRMIFVEYTVMPLVWDVMPICMIYYLH